MNGGDWLQLSIAAVGGGTSVKFFDILYDLYRRRKDLSKSRGDSIDKSFDPLLKSADELAGKLRSLAEQAFEPITSLKDTDNAFENSDFRSLLFLFVQFWAQIEILRIHGLNVDMAKTGRGEQLKIFFDCLESRRVRVIDRMTQRAAGESLIVDLRPMPFIDFVKFYEAGEQVRRWTDPLVKFLILINNTHERQQLLQYHTTSPMT